MQIKTSTVIHSLKGEPFKDGGDDLTIGVALSNIISYDKTAGKHKAYILAKKLMTEDKTVEVDSADMSLIKKAVETSELYSNNVVTGFLLEYLESLKEEAKADGKPAKDKSHKAV